MFHIPAHKQAKTNAAPAQATVTEYRVSLHTANGPVVTALKSMEAALDLVRMYVVDGKSVSIEVSNA